MEMSDVQAPPPPRTPPNALTAVSETSDFTPEQSEAIEARSLPTAALIHETIRAEGETELERSVIALTLSGLAAGLSMGFSLVAEGLMQRGLPDAPWRELVSNLGYTVGFLIVVLGRQQLFTENTLTPILPLLYHRNAMTLWRVLRLWAVVLAANLVATAIFAAVIAHADLFDSEAKRSFAEISRKAIEFPFGTTFLKAVFAGWLIALMVWLLPAAETARPAVILIITYVVALGGFTHIVAGSVDAFYLVHTGEMSFADYMTRFFVPTLLGNVLGGGALVGVLNYGQVAPEIK